MGSTLSWLALLNWLDNCKHHNILNLGCIAEMRELCIAVDASNLSIDPRLGLEIHQTTRNQTDLSLFGDYALLEIPSISYPRFAAEWTEFSKDHHTSMDQSIIVEFDHTGKGYKLMGFFQNYAAGPQGAESALESIKFYANCRHKEFTQSKAISTTTDQAISMLEGTIEDLGTPAYIGFVDRGMCAVKLITNVTNKNLAAVSKFCGLHFATAVNHHFISAKALSSILEELLSIYKHIRLSVDYNLLTAGFLDRISFECVPFRPFLKEETQSNEEPRTKKDPCLALKKLFTDYAKSLMLEQVLPYGERRPSSLDLIDEEAMIIAYSHRKLILGNNYSGTKDYVMVYGEKYNL